MSNPMLSSLPAATVKIDFLVNVNDMFIAGEAKVWC